MHSDFNDLEDEQETKHSTLCKDYSHWLGVADGVRCHMGHDVDGRALLQDAAIWLYDQLIRVLVRPSPSQVIITHGSPCLNSEGA